MPPLAWSTSNGFLPASVNSARAFEPMYSTGLPLPSVMTLPLASALAIANAPLGSSMTRIGPDGVPPACRLPPFGIRKYCTLPSAEVSTSKLAVLTPGITVGALPSCSMSPNRMPPMPVALSYQPNELRAPALSEVKVAVNVVVPPPSLSRMVPVAVPAVAEMRPPLLADVSVRLRVSVLSSSGSSSVAIETTLLVSPAAKARLRPGAT